MDTKIKRIVFSDFDGTITSEETFVSMLKYFSPELFSKKEKELISNKLTLKEAVRDMVESIPSSKYKDVVAFINTKKIRPGFSKLLDFLSEENVPFVVVSGGLQDIVENRLTKWRSSIHSIFAAKVDASDKYLKVISDFEKDNELIAKVDIMELFDFDESVAIGDGITDHKMALNATHVFARSNLATYLKKRKKEYIYWNTFKDVKNHLQKLWE